MYIYIISSTRRLNFIILIAFLSGCLIEVFICPIHSSVAYSPRASFKSFGSIGEDVDKVILSFVAGFDFAEHSVYGDNYDDLTVTHHTETGNPGFVGTEIDVIEDDWGTQIFDYDISSIAKDYSELTIGFTFYYNGSSDFLYGVGIGGGDYKHV